MRNVSFTEEQIVRFLDQATASQLDEFDFGVVKLQVDGIVASYNKYESDLATFSKENVIGKNFFTQIAPCTNNFMVAAKYMEYLEPRDEYLDYVFTYKIEPTRVKLRLLTHPYRTYQYLLVKKYD
ncbi:MAG: photoactive yellow protein [Bacteroidota bacterium]